MNAADFGPDLVRFGLAFAAALAAAVLAAAARRLAAVGLFQRAPAGRERRP